MRGRRRGEHRSRRGHRRRAGVRGDHIVQSAKPLGHGLYRLSLDNGQVWDTREADWAMDFKSSDTVTISRMVLGGYQISTSSSARSVAAKRIE